MALNISLYKWRKPIHGWVKVSIDAGRRDYLERVIASRSILFLGSGNSLVAEAMSCREAFSWLKQQGFNNVILEMDALIVVNALNNNSSFLAPIWFHFMGL